MTEHETEPAEQQDTVDEDLVKELESSLARVQADYANYRRRVEEQSEQLRKRAAEAVIKDMLQIADNLELALRQVAQKDQDELYEGVELILGQLISTLENNGVERIHAEEFDPLQHEALLTEPSMEPKGKIIEVLQPGYKLGEKVLRSAKVKLSAGPEEQS